jgi:hypothetical protein
MHASIWRFSGDPDDLLGRYDALIADIAPENMRLHLCLRAPDGIVLIDTCPSKEAFESFAHGDAFRVLLERHGLGEPDQLEDFPVHRVFRSG